MRVPLLKAVQLTLAAVVLVLTAACAPPQPPPSPGQAHAQQTYHYQRDIQPIFDRKCVACHACYDAPCQLQLGSAQGVARGAFDQPVYASARPRAAEPTRLGIDAFTVADWRRKGFWSVSDGGSAALLRQALDLGDAHRWPANARLPDELELGMTRTNACPKPEVYPKFAQSRPVEGMPLGVTGLTDTELQVLRTWIDQGAQVEPRQLRPSAAEQREVDRWEAWFNQPGAERALVARYLFEHLFLAHLYVADQAQPRFFRLIRSSTPPGQPIEPLGALRPNRAPPAEMRFWYRLSLIDETLTFKTHLSYSISKARLERYDQLFFGQAWTVAEPVGYSVSQRSNPFETFASIPVQARYRFMLDDAGYFVDSFIRGPVCRGQVATDVIRDRFWTLFQTPESDQYVTNEAYRTQVTPLLAVPGENEQLLALGPEWHKYRGMREQYQELRQQGYARALPAGPSLSDLWMGDGHNRDALLTVFRHHDSASVRRGLIGVVPDTIWVMDYPLLERTYYELVVNYNVFGSVSHQLQTRLYFDLIRNGSELNFLRFLPAESRLPLLQAWYRNPRNERPLTRSDIIDSTAPGALAKGTVQPMQVFAERLYRQAGPVMGPADAINRCAQGCAGERAPDAVRKALRSLTARPAAQQPFILHMPDFTLLRVVHGKGRREVYSLLHDRAHYNVAFLFREDRRQEPEQDRLTIVPGIAGSYPNFAFDVPAAEVPDFARQLAAVASTEQLQVLVERWGVRRTHPQFWDIFHDFTAYLRETEPVEAATLDMSRWQNL